MSHSQLYEGKRSCVCVCVVCVCVCKHRQTQITVGVVLGGGVVTGTDRGVDVVGVEVLRVVVAVEVSWDASRSGTIQVRRNTTIET